jgi:hypothetical protein
LRLSTAVSISGLVMCRTNDASMEIARRAISTQITCHSRGGNAMQLVCAFSHR